MFSGIIGAVGRIDALKNLQVEDALKMLAGAPEDAVILANL